MNRAIFFWLAGPHPRSCCHTAIAALGARAIALGLGLSLVAVVLTACSETVEEQSATEHTGHQQAPVTGMTTPTAAFDKNGKLWAVWVESSNVWLSSSPDLGKTFEPAVRVTAEAEPIDANCESRPKIAFARNNAILVSWTRKGK